VASFGLATNRMVRNASGSQEELTQFHQIVCWDKLADIVGEYVKKGRQLYVEGRLEYRTYEDGSGEKRGVAEVIASDVQFLGAKPSEKEAEAAAEL
jgi:single-strand DNA-binding protein